MKVLLCEDDPTVALDLWWLLHEQGHSICGIVRDGSKLLPKAEATRPDLVMLDAEVRDPLSATPLAEALAQSGFASVIVSRGPVVAPFGAVLRKPFTEACVVSAMARAERASQLGLVAR